jgi:hypothetical protein
MGLRFQEEWCLPGWSGGVTSNDSLGEVPDGAWPRVTDCHTRLATDAPDEGSGSVRRGPAAVALWGSFIIVVCFLGLR